MSKAPLIKVRRPDGPRSLTPTEEKIIGDAPNMPPAPPPPKEQEPVTKMLLEVPTRLHKKLKMHCVQEETSMKDVVILLLEDFLKDK